MRTVLVSLSLSLAMLYAASTPADKLAYPAATRADTVDDYNGVKVPAPYRWMEDLNNPDVAKWVEAENKLTFSYLDKIPERAWMQQRLKQLWNY